MCVDEFRYSTLWTAHSVVGASISLRDMTAARPSFRRDVSGLTRLFSEFPTQTALAEYDKRVLFEISNHGDTYLYVYQKKSR